MSHILRFQILRKLFHTDVTEERTFFFLTLLVGFIGGATAAFFKLMILYASHWIRQEGPITMNGFFYGLTAIFISGFLTTRFFPNTAGSGIPRVKIALAVLNGKIPFSETIGKILTSLFSLISGVSAGREGPTVSIASGVASSIGAFLHLSKKRIKALVSVGGAGGLAAAFNTPIAGVVFTLEEVVGDLNTKMLGSMIISSVVAVITANIIQGNIPTFIVPQYKIGDPKELIIYLIIGLAAGIGGVLWVKSVLKLRSINHRIFHNHKFTIIITSYMLVIALSLIDYRILGDGHHVTNDILLSHFTSWELLGLLFFLKFLATTITYASGVSGGLFMPTLTMGASLGGAIGVLGIHFLEPQLGSIGAFAIVGMGAFFVSVIRVPFTAIIMIFEMTHDYKIILPLMIANVSAYFIANIFQKGSVYEALSEQDGVHLPTREDNDVLESLVVEDAMVKEPFTLNASLTTRDVFRQLNGKFEYTGFPVMKNGNLFGMVSLSDMARSHAKNHGDVTIESIATRNIISVYPDCSLFVAFHKLKQHNISRLAVVSRLNDKRLLGLITAEDIVSRFGFHIHEEKKNFKIEDIESKDEEEKEEDESSTSHQTN